MTIYIDNECKCHVSNPDGTYTAIEAPEQFNGKCAAYIEGYRFVPAGETWTREDGQVFTGEMVAPWVDSKELEAAQIAYERQQYTLLLTENADMKAALEVMEVSL